MTERPDTQPARTWSRVRRNNAYRRGLVDGATIYRDQLAEFLRGSSKTEATQTIADATIAVADTTLQIVKMREDWQQIPRTRTAGRTEHGED